MGSSVGRTAPVVEVPTGVRVSDGDSTVAIGGSGVGVFFSTEAIVGVAEGVTAGDRAPWVSV